MANAHLFVVLNLLHKLNFDERDDHLILAGDAIYKGPDSTGVIDYVRSIRASCVRGNHEDRTLLAHAALQKEKNAAVKQGNDGDSFPDAGGPAFHI